MGTPDKMRTWTNGIEFLERRIEHAESIGEVTFYSEARFPGRIAFGNESHHFQDRFECHFAEGYVARSGGLVDEQEITLLLDGQLTPVIYEQHREIGTMWFGYRPIIEVETPDGQYLHFSYRPTREGNAWFQYIPLNEYTPYGSLSRHWDRIRNMLVELFYCVIGCGGAAIAATLLAICMWKAMGI